MTQVYKICNQFKKCVITFYYYGYVYLNYFIYIIILYFFIIDLKVADLLIR